MRCKGELVLRENWLVEQSVLRWFGHMQRMEENQLVKRIIGFDARGVRLRGRQQTDRCTV